MKDDGTEHWTQLTTRVPTAVRRAIKLHCVSTDTTAMDFVSQAIAEKLQRDAKKTAGRGTRRA